MFSLQLALLILSLDLPNRFSVLNIGIGYVGMSERPVFSISELTIGEFQDYKIIPKTRYVGFALFIGGAKLFPSLLLDRIDRTFEFVRTLRVIPGGGLAAVSVFIYSPKAVFSIYSGDEVFNVVPNIRFQLIPISDLLLLNIFSPSLFTKKVYTPGPYPHFELSPGVRGISENFDFELKFGIRTYSILHPSLSQAEKLAIKHYEETKAKKIIGKEFSQKYGILFFFNFALGVGLPSYYITKIITREEREVQMVAVETPELKERIAELERKLAELERLRAEEEKKREEEIRKILEAQQAKEREEKIEREKEKEEKVVKVETEVKGKVLVSEIWKVHYISIDKYEKGGKLHLSWRFPTTENLEEVSLERCLGYGCTNFNKVTSLSTSVTSYVDQIVENQIYCYRLSAFIAKEETDPKVKEKIKETVRTGVVCGYVSYKGELVRVYF